MTQMAHEFERDVIRVSRVQEWKRRRFKSNLLIVAIVAVLISANAYLLWLPALAHG